MKIETLPWALRRLGPPTHILQIESLGGPIAHVYGPTPDGSPALTSTGKPTAYAADLARAEGHARFICAAVSACHGLAIPDNVPPGALAALVSTARGLLKAYDARGYGCGEEAQELENAMAPFTT